MSSAPIISVIVDTYNHQNYIGQALTSVLEQDFPPTEFEILVIDDGSSDRTPEIVRKFAPRIRLIEKVNGGQASAFNLAIPKTNGQIVAFLDGDDWWAPDKLSSVLKAFSTHPLAAAVGHGFYEVNESGPPSAVVVAKSTCILDLSSPSAARVAVLGRSLLGTSRLAIRRTALNRIGSLPVNLVFCADTPLLTLSLALGGAVILEEPLCYYRIHSSNLFASDGTEERTKLEKVLTTLRFLHGFLPSKLYEFGVSRAAINAFMELDRLEIERLEIRLNLGGRWKNFCAELRSFRANYTSPSPLYSAFKLSVAAAALIFSPTQFAEVRNWYGQKNLKRFRSRFARAVPSASPELFQRRILKQHE
jgi:glycosyltransferase involved in cell wall biosynthesis